MDITMQLVVAAVASFIIFVSVTVIISKRCKKISHPPPKPCRPTAVVAIEVDHHESSVNHISMSEAVVATNNFSPELIIGEGSFGLVYKGQLNDGNKMVAIKRLSHNNENFGLREFRAEVETLCKLQHFNIVKLLGYCVSGGDRLLVYEFMEKGSLHQWLYRLDHDEELSSASTLILRQNENYLSWETRIKIIKDVAQGLSYMHDLETPILHRDIKPANILLDSNFRAHIADFGLARIVMRDHSHVSTNVGGSLGYMPLEYKEGITFGTTKADVYSFGVTILEIMTGRRPFCHISLTYGKDVSLVEWARRMIEQNQVLEMIDPSIPREGLVIAQIEDCFRIAVLCVSDYPRERPTMGTVVDLLNQISV